MKNRYIVPKLRSRRLRVSSLLSDSLPLESDCSNSEQLAKPYNGNFHLLFEDEQ